MINENRRKYYVDLIKTSFSLREVCLKANIVVTTGNYNTLKRIIKEENLDTSHFKRQSISSKNSQPIEFYLRENTNISSFKLKNKIFKEKLKECKCECCGNTEWMGKPIKLELHHINGVNTDNRLENLQILCPNCHAYTDNYGGKNQKNNIKKKNTSDKKNKTKIDIVLLQKLLDENKDLKTISNVLNKSPRTIKKYIKKYALKVQEKNSFDLNEMISLMKKHKSYSKVGKLIGVSDNAIKKRFIKCGYPNNIKTLLNYIDKLDNTLIMNCYS